MTVSWSLIILSYFPDREDENTRINVLRLPYAYSPDLYLRLFAQNNTGEDRTYLYAVIGWRFVPPFSALYITWSQDGYHWPDSSYKEQLLFLKLSYQFGG